MKRKLNDPFIGVEVDGLTNSILHTVSGYIKEPDGIDLNIAPMDLSEEDRQVLSAVIAQYKRTKEVPASKPKTAKKARMSTSRSTAAKRRKSTAKKAAVSRK